MIQAHKIIGDPVGERRLRGQRARLVQELALQDRIIVANSGGLDQEARTAPVAGVFLHKAPRRFDDSIPHGGFAPDRALEKKRNPAEPRVGTLFRRGSRSRLERRQDPHRLIGLLRHIVHFSCRRQDRSELHAGIESAGIARVFG